MTFLRARVYLQGVVCVLFLILGAPGEAQAQRSLHWSRLDVVAHLDADGTLDVSETQSIVFTGDWNGGERRFIVHPRQTFTFVGIWRITSNGREELRQDGSLDDVDDYAWADTTTLRWRSRRPSAPPFANTTLRYEIRYRMSGILLKDDDGYTLDHDFAFRDRDGVIERFTLKLTLDPAWQAVDSLRSDYTAGPLTRGVTFVVTAPLRYTGTGTPLAFDSTRPPAIASGVPILLGFTALGVLWFFIREQRYGRFEPIPYESVNESWLNEHVFQHPPEVIGAAWDEWVGSPEVVALLARLEAEGTLESSLEVGNVMRLRLKADRESLTGHARALVDALFFDGNTETSTVLVRAHYRKKGLNLPNVIEKDLRRAVAAMMPAGDAPRRFPWISPILFFTGLVLLLLEWSGGGLQTSILFWGVGASIVVFGVAVATGSGFRKTLEWGRAQALACLVPAIVLTGAVVIFLWFYAGVGMIDLSPRAVYGVLLVGAGLTLASINASKSQQRREGMALRKRLAAARAYFDAELNGPQPALRDAWYPWLLGFGLGKQIDRWSADLRAGAPRRPNRSDARSVGSSSSAPPAATWTGFGGGQSGGAGASAGWQAAAVSMAAPVSAASSSGSGGRSSGSRSGGGSSSSGGSSGGGGGGGW